MKSSERQSDKTARDISTSKLAQRLQARGNKPVGLIDTKTFNKRRSIPRWIEKRMVQLHQLSSRYNFDDEMAAENSGLVFASRSQSLSLQDMTQPLSSKQSNAVTGAPFSVQVPNKPKPANTAKTLIQTKSISQRQSQPKKGNYDSDDDFSRASSKLSSPGVVNTSSQSQKTSAQKFKVRRKRQPPVHDHFDKDDDSQMDPSQRAPKLAQKVKTSDLSKAGSGEQLGTLTRNQKAVLQKRMQGEKAKNSGKKANTDAVMTKQYHTSQKRKTDPAISDTFETTAIKSKENNQELLLRKYASGDVRKRIKEVSQQDKTSLPTAGSTSLERTAPHDRYKQPLSATESLLTSKTKPKLQLKISKKHGADKLAHAKKAVVVSEHKKRVGISELTNGSGEPAMVLRKVVNTPAIGGEERTVQAFGSNKPDATQIIVNRTEGASGSNTDTGLVNQDTGFDYELGDLSGQPVEIRVPQIAEQVARIIYRQLAVERERRGLGRWH